MTVYVIADPHLGDRAVENARRHLLPGVDNLTDELLRRWNAIVRAEDTVYVLDDLGKRHHLRAIHHLNGSKHLVAGNGDDVAYIAALGVFASIVVARSLPGALLTHIPVHPSQLRGRTINVHGHMHAGNLSDPRYRCVSVEQTAFEPVRLESLVKKPANPAQQSLL